MKIIVELSTTTGMLDCWDIWYELSFGKASPILFGRRSKKPSFMSQYFLQQRRRMRRRKISFSKRAFVSKMLRISSQITSSYIIAYSCPVYLLLYHSSLLWWFFKTCTQWWSFHLNFLWSWIPFFVGKKVMMLTKCSAMPVPDSGVLWGF